ncbi:MAG TPA: pentapeptide repeat-containing protein [Ktedonobacterales bacterium]|nr:pentapeptide repeat-containing protein [Ktedonobacterales bacterium]
MGQPPRRRPATTTASDTTDDWPARWRGQGQPWRREGEIAPERQALLAERRAVNPDPARNSYPFARETLSRGDIEWLLATLEDGRGPVDWDDHTQRAREGLDLRGARLAGLDLRGLPLARLRAGLTEDEWRNLPGDALENAAAHLEGADLSGARLEGAILEGAHLEEARLSEARLPHANLSFAHLEGAYLARASMEKAYLLATALLGAALDAAHLEGAHLGEANLAGASLAFAHLEGAHLGEARLGGAAVDTATLARVRDWRPGFPETLAGANLSGAFFDPATTLDDAEFGDTIYGGVSVADARWGGVNLAVMEWERVPVLGEEREALRATTQDGSPKPEHERLREFQLAVRANRQLAVALQDQGLNEEAARYAYRAQSLQRQALGRQMRRGEWRKAGPWLFSWMLNLLGGYGYRMARILAAYTVVILVFTAAYLVIGASAAPHLNLPDALLASLTAFHGRVFSSQFQADSPQAWVSALEAVAGLVVEGVFIAMLAQRFFGK